MNGGVFACGFLPCIANYCNWMPTLTGGACCFKIGCLTSSLPGRVHLGNVTNVVFRSTPCSQDPDRDHIICSK